MQFQDEVTFVMERGFSADYVLWMDCIAFRGLHDSCERRETMQQMENVNLMRLAQHGDEKAMKEKTDEFYDRLGFLGTAVKTVMNAASFLTKYAKGI